MKAPLLSFLDPSVVRRIPVQFTRATGDNAGPNTEAWVWPFLRSILATAIPFDEADAVVLCVQASFILEEQRVVRS